MKSRLGAPAALSSATSLASWKVVPPTMNTTTSFRACGHNYGCNDPQ